MHSWPPIRNGVTRLGGLNEEKIESVITDSPFRKETRTPKWQSTSKQLSFMTTVEFMQQ